LQEGLRKHGEKIREMRKRLERIQRGLEWSRPNAGKSVGIEDRALGLAGWGDSEMPPPP
jgi:hypothetical protein